MQTTTRGLVLDGQVFPVNLQTLVVDLGRFRKLGLFEIHVPLFATGTRAFQLATLTGGEPLKLLAQLFHRHLWGTLVNQFFQRLHGHFGRRVTFLQTQGAQVNAGNRVGHAQNGFPRGFGIQLEGRRAGVFGPALVEKVGL